ncbi:hypothetical protein PISMIDRAFT_15985 [Pisolithus microcarpus 441]|uniref:CCHC-type domain-containing protein n=1 Tax=Pisolithus microcarpus 441 TaxID=765257 RepID=A0A0C9XUZ0_9AGAM|nr:hypothetical protein PISMIDRAFT_15985 [Pisolithus microcarpus 441]
MTSLQEGTSTSVPNPVPRQSKQPSAPVPQSSQPTVGLQYWHRFYHPESEHPIGGCSSSSEVNSSWEFNVNKPSLFSGKYGELRPWLNQIAAYLALNAHIYKTDHVKIRLALSYMTMGIAGAFTSNYIAKYVNGWEDQHYIEINREAGDQKAQAVIKLKFLTQGDHPLENYMAKFLGLFNQAGLLPTPVKGGVLFAQGLSCNLRDHILDRQHPPTNINKWVRAAREVYTSQISKDIYNKSPNMPHRPNPFTFPKPTRDPNAMDIDQAQCTPCRGRSVRAITCYNCGKEGHIKRECQDKPQVAKEILHRQAGERLEKMFEVSDRALKDF